MPTSLSHVTLQEPRSVEAVLYNNYMKTILDNPDKLRERWDFALCCIPILVDHEACFDVRTQATPEMKGPGLDKWGKALDETDLMAAHMQEQPQDLQEKLRKLRDRGRDVVVLRIVDPQGDIVNHSGRGSQLQLNLNMNLNVTEVRFDRPWSGEPFDD